MTWYRMEPVNVTVTPAIVTSPPTEEKSSRRSWTFAPATISGTVDCWIATRLPPSERSAKSAVSTEPSNPRVWSVAKTGCLTGAIASQSTAISIRLPAAAAMTCPPWVHPLQSRGSWPEFHSYSVLTFTEPRHPDTSSIRSAPRGSTRYPVPGLRSASMKIRTESNTGGVSPPRRADPPTSAKKARKSTLSATANRTRSTFGLISGFRDCDVTADVGQSDPLPSITIGYEGPVTPAGKSSGRRMSAALSNGITYSFHLPRAASRRYRPAPRPFVNPFPFVRPFVIPRRRDARPLTRPFVNPFVRPRSPFVRPFVRPRRPFVSPFVWPPR